MPPLRSGPKVALLQERPILQRGYEGEPKSTLLENGKRQPSKKNTWRKKIRRSEIDAKIKMPKMGFSKKRVFEKMEKTEKSIFRKMKNIRFANAKKKHPKKDILEKGGSP